jgi:hypothetical protein
MIADLASELELMIKDVSMLGNLPTETLHKIIFCSFVKAGLNIYGASDKHKNEVENLIKTIAVPYRGLVNGKLYRNALRFIRNLDELLHSYRQAVILEEANLHYILDFLEDKVGRVDVVFVLDCASIPEVVSIAGKFLSLNRKVTIFEKLFINPVGITRFLTGQLESFNREIYLKQYAQLLKDRLKANFSVKISTIDLVTHQYGFTLDSFLEFIGMQKLFNQINHFARQNSVLITSDHGYDVVADEHGLYITHGYKKECPLNFSKIAPFLVVD